HNPINLLLIHDLSNNQNPSGSLGLLPYQRENLIETATDRMLRQHAAYPKQTAAAPLIGITGQNPQGVGSFGLIANLPHQIRAERFLDAPRVSTDDWRTTSKQLKNPAREHGCRITDRVYIKK